MNETYTEQVDQCPLRYQVINRRTKSNGIFMLSCEVMEKRPAKPETLYRTQAANVCRRSWPLFMQKSCRF